MGNLLLLLEWAQCCLEKDQMDLIVLKEAERRRSKTRKEFRRNSIKKAGKTGRALGYAHERGLSGLASDGATMASERATKPFKSMRDIANDTKNKFKEGLDDGTVSAINKNSKPMLAKIKKMKLENMLIPCQHVFQIEKMVLKLKMPIELCLVLNVCVKQ